MTVRIVDAHVHLWDVSAFSVPWFRDDLGLPAVSSVAAYREIVGSCGVSAAIAVQVADSTDEARWLTAQTSSEAVLTRAVLQYEPAVGRALGATAFDGARFSGIRAAVPQRAADLSDVPALDDLATALGERGRVLELLLRPEQLPGAAALAARHPQTAMVLCHLGLGYGEVRAEWRRGLAAFAAQPNAHAKFSGLLSPTRTDAELTRLATIAFELFGAERLMFGSDWPMASRTGDFAQLLGRVREAVADAAGTAFWSDTADRLYR